MSCLNEEENALSQSSNSEPAGDKGKASSLVEGARADLQPDCPAEDDRPAVQPNEERPFWNSSSPHRRRMTLDDGAERDGLQAWATEPTGGEFLDLAALGPPQGSSSPVKPTLDQRPESRGRADGDGVREPVSGASPQLDAARCWLDCTVASVRRVPPVGDLPSTATADGELQGDANPQLDLSRVSESSGLFCQPLDQSLSNICADSGSDIASAKLKCKKTSSPDSSFAMSLPCTEEDITNKRGSHSCIADRGKLLSRSVCGSSSFENKCNSQTFHSKDEALSRAGCNFYVEELESHTRNVKLGTPRPVFDKRISSTVETSQGRVTLNRPQGSKAGMKPQRVQSKLELGTQDTSENVKARFLDRNRQQTSQHQESNTSALPLADVTAQVHNVKSSLAQSSHTGKFALTPKDKTVKAHQSTLVASQSFQELQFKHPLTQQGAVAKSVKTKKQRRRQQQQQQRMKPLTDQRQQQQSGQDMRNSLCLSRSASRLPAPKGSHMFNNKPHLQSSGSHKQTASNLPDYSTVRGFGKPGRDITGQNSGANRHQHVGLPLPPKSLECNSNTGVPHSVGSRMLSPVSVTVEKTPQIYDSNTGKLFPDRCTRQEPLVQRTVSVVNNRPGILLSDEIPTRDGENWQQLPRGSIDRTGVELSGFLVDTTQRMETAPARQNFQLETSDVRQSTTCALPVFRGRNFETAEAGTQTILSVSTSPGESRRVSTAPPAHNSQQMRQRYWDETTPTWAVRTTPSSRELNLVQRAPNWTPRGLYPVCQRFPVPIYPQPAVWQHSYNIPVSFQIPPGYVPLYPRYPQVPRLLAVPSIQYRAFGTAGVNFPYSPPVPPMRFPTSRVYYAPPVEPTWVRPPLVYHGPPADRFWQSLPRAHQHRPRSEPHPSRQATNERVAAWLQQVDTAQAEGEGEGRPASSTAPSSDSGIPAAASSSSRSASSRRHSRDSNAPAAGDAPACATTCRSQQ